MTEILLAIELTKNYKSPMKTAKHWTQALTLSTLSILCLNISVRASEKITLVFGPLKRSVKVSSLENFVKTGEVNRDLQFYLSSTSTEQRETFRKALVQPIPIKGVPLSQFLRSGIGIRILEKFGRIVTLPRGTNGKFAIRGSMVQAALSPDGLTLLNILHNFPTNVQIDGEVLLRVNRSVKNFVDSTNESTKILQNLAAREAEADSPVDFTTMPDITKPGPYKYDVQRLDLRDLKRKRSFYTLLYKPTVPGKDKIPVVIVSHGFASRPEDFTTVAKVLASYGFFVAVPQHPGSDLQQARSFLNGTTSKVFEVQEFTNRPKDISYVIDELERRNPGEYQSRLELKKVGILGHSLGGYTALAVSGAQIDFANLKKDCADTTFGYLNLSILMQCEALDLESKQYNFTDPRIAAVMARNPLNSSIFGQNGLAQVKIPTFLIAGSYDFATPVIFEQMFSFPWLKNTPTSYLGLIEGQAHVDFSKLDAGVTELLDSVTSLNLPNPDLVNVYMDSVSVAFFKVYIVSDNKYLPYLQPAYAAHLSKDQAFPFSLLTNRSKTAILEEGQKIKQRFAIGR